jgi:bifunctional non-homologous end joining protein LigD
VYVPLNRGEATYDDTKPFAHGVAKVLEQRHDLIVSVMKKEVRGGKVFIDWSQNDRHKTTVGPYSLRARPRPTVSTPLTWDEVDHGAGGDADDLVFEAADVLGRIEEHGDLFAGVVEQAQELPEL